jgi:hypothetical protein
MVKEGLFGQYHVMIDLTSIRQLVDAKRWCMENVTNAADSESRITDSMPYGWTYESFPKCANFVFNCEKDAVWFALRWA